MSTRQFNINYNLEYEVIIDRDKSTNSCTIENKEMEITLKGFISKERKAGFDTEQECWYPGDPAEMEIEEIENEKGKDVYDFVLENINMHDLEQFVVDNL